MSLRATSAYVGGSKDRGRCHLVASSFFYIQKHRSSAQGAAACLQHPPWKPMCEADLSQRTGQGIVVRAGATVGGAQHVPWMSCHLSARAD